MTNVQKRGAQRRHPAAVLAFACPSTCPWRRSSQRHQGILGCAGSPS